jgi:hypothetical protein
MGKFFNRNLCKIRLPMSTVKNGIRIRTEDKGRNLAIPHFPQIFVGFAGTKCL